MLRGRGSVTRAPASEWDYSSWSLEDRRSLEESLEEDLVPADRFVPEDRLEDRPVVEVFLDRVEPLDLRPPLRCFFSSATASSWLLTTSLSRISPRQPSTSSALATNA
jgi:hypothetical protein